MIDLNAAHDRQKAFAALNAGQFEDAHQLASKVLRANKKDQDMLRVRGRSELSLGHYHDARKSFEKVLALQPNDVTGLMDLGYACLWGGDVQEALTIFDRVLSITPGFARAIAGKASAFERNTQFDEVRNLLEPIVRAGKETPTMAVSYVRMLQHAGDHDASATLAVKHLANSSLDHVTRHTLCELAAKAYEKLGQYDKAFAAFSDSNAIKAQPFKADEYVAQFDQLMQVFAASNLSKLPRSRMRSDLPVFIASMPRSGSTLVEQIIHAHPKGYGAGEIQNLHHMVQRLSSTLSSMWPYPGCMGDFRQHHADALSKTYLDELRRFDKRATRIVNKHLDNYHHLGMIELLWPGARVIHVKRDPLDNCFSLFMAQMSPNTYPWSTDLTNIALAYRVYEQLMAHWRSVLEIPMLDVQYEDLVEDTETWIRKIIDFCGLPWDDTCLRYWEAERTVMTLSFDQVNKPIYKSAVKRHEKYEAFIAPLREALGMPKG